MKQFSSQFPAIGAQQRRFHFDSGLIYCPSTSRISEEQLFYCLQRGISEEDAVSLIVNGFCKEVMKELPMEFAVEAQKLIGISLEGSVG